MGERRMKMKDMDVSRKLDFVREAYKACKDKNEAEFKCTYCGGDAVALKSVNNKHVLAKCRKCGAGFLR